MLVIVRLILIILVVVVNVLLNNVLIEKEDSKKKDKEFDTVFKILINHSQQVGVIPIPNIVDYSIIFTTYFQFIEYASFGDPQMIINECIAPFLYESAQNFQFSKLLTAMLFPLLFAFFSIICWILVHSIRNKLKLLQILSKFCVFLILCTFLFYSLILKTSLGLFQCSQLDIESKSVYLKQSPKIECWSVESGHIFLISFLGIPSLAFWGIIYPLVLGLILQNNYRKITNTFNHEGQKLKIFEIKQNRHELNVFKTENEKSSLNRDSYRKVFSFFYRGFQSKYCFWECIIFVRKFLLSLFSALNETLKGEITETFLILILVFFLCLNLHKEPYSSRYGNKLENFSLITCLITFATTYISATIDDDYKKSALIAIILVLNIGFLVICGSLMLKETMKIYQSWWKNKSLKSIFFKTQSKYNKEGKQQK